ncbi:MAC/perforin domain-containing protein [Microbulbifer aggregans]|uniref:MAC/perforin domain-containing protein n=1 Tax=Microbulbifer aggregans TaxID=1769779 RepID=UPI001CFDCEA4|nr:MAC/perforin domain-containing protein [Microbulbifer aggregans]
MKDQDPPKEVTLTQFVGSVTSKLKNVSYLGRLFDITKINPLDLEESAKLLTALQFKTTDFESIADGSRLLPKGVGYRPETGGDQVSESQMIFESSTLEKKFTQHVKVNAGLEGVVSASASVMFNSFARTNRGRRAMFTWMSAEVEAPAIRLLGADDGYTDGHNLSPEFTNAVIALKVDGGETEYDNFVQKFGTHFATEVTFGGMAYQTIRIDSETYESLIEENIDISTEAEATFKQFSGGASYSESNKKSKEFKRQTETTQEQLRFRGGVPNSDINAWMASVPGNPAPIRVSLEQLDKLFTKEYFPEKDIEEKGKLLARAIEKHIKSGSVGNPNNIFVIDNDNKLAVYSYEGANGVGKWISKKHPLVTLQKDENIDFAFSAGNNLIFTLDNKNTLKRYEFSGAGEHMTLKPGSGNIVSHNFSANHDDIKAITASSDGMIFEIKKPNNGSAAIFWYQCISESGAVGWQIGSGSKLHKVPYKNAFCVGDHKLYFYDPTPDGENVARNQYLGSSGENIWVKNNNPIVLNKTPWKGLLQEKLHTLIGRADGIFFAVDEGGSIYWFKDNGFDIKSDKFVAAPGSGTRLDSTVDLEKVKFIF